MQYEHREQCKTHDPDEIIAGRSSWATTNTRPMSVKYAWRDSRGRVCRGGEIPVEALPQMVEVGIRHAGLSAKAVLQAVARAIA